MDEKISMIHQLCPCRNKIITSLLQFITVDKVTDSTQSLFLYGNTGTGKTWVVKTLLDQLEVR